MKSLHVKKGDRVSVISGKDKGTVGEVIAVDPSAERVIVSGVNIAKRHKKDQASQRTNAQVTKGGIISAEPPIQAYNLALLVKFHGKEVTTRVGYKRVEITKRRSDGSEYQSTRAVRIARKTGEEI